MDKSAKRKKTERVRAEEAAINRVLYWIAGGAVLEFFLLLLNRYWVYYKVSEYNIHIVMDVALKILAVAGLLCAAGALYWWSSAGKARRGRELPGLLCLFMLGLSASCFLCWLFGASGLQLACVVVPVVIVLALIFYVYQHEFFLIALQSALALLGIWICGRSLGSSMHQLLGYVYAVLAAALVLAGAWLSRKVQGEKGRLTWKDRTVKIFSKDANYALLYLSAIVALVVLVVAAIGISGVVLYAVEVAWLLIMAVYYTVKLM